MITSIDLKFSCSYYRSAPIHQLLYSVFWGLCGSVIGSQTQLQILREEVEHTFYIEESTDSGAWI